MTLVMDVTKPLKEKWKVWINGECETAGVGVGIVLQGLEGIKLCYAEKIIFSTTNNVAKRL